jgi:hypothetical protein
MTIVIYIIIKLCAMKPIIKLLEPRTTIMLLIMILLPAITYSLTPLSAQSDSSGDSSGDSSADGSTTSASQDYQEFQSCLSGAEVDGYASEQQIRDCFAPIYNTGASTTGPAPSDTSSGGEDSSSPSTSGENDGGSSDEDENSDE